MDMKSHEDDDDCSVRTGNVWTATAHLITVLIGAGTLSLPWCVGKLGWALGSIVIITFGIVTSYTAILLCECYRTPYNGRNRNYMAAVNTYLGKKQVWLCALVQYICLFGATIGYTVTASMSMVSIQKSHCLNKHDQANCHTNNNLFTIGFGLVEIVLSQIPNIDELRWLSICASVMAFTYTSIGLGLSSSKISGGHSLGTITRVDGGIVPFKEKLWGVFQALGNIACAYNLMLLLLEIQDTLKSSPPENKTMKKAIFLGMTISTIVYISIASIGYAAFRDNVPGNILSGFYDPYWLVIIANACVIGQLVGAYQLCGQVIFSSIEKLGTHYHLPFSPFVLKLLLRTFYVACTTTISMIIPFFNDVLGMIGAFGFWPLGIYFPIAMYLSKTKLRPWNPKWIMLHIICIIFFPMSLVAGIGSIAGILDNLRGNPPLKTFKTLILFWRSH